ncbi:MULTISPECIES: hypothetical protein [Pseudomonas]|uniref:Uncharacterized protein n=1 Tax=Pseudomonas lini TaxID=163011 RepID=A0A0J6H1W4_9PSED|nr:MULTISPECIES: hypothetical protein [Pseudomonas]KAB0508098.1 hypothetical protein F7R14_00115 [Pseudomonas lini]KMM88254.1 hypothetical protein TU81_28175 [Pseudomonas lini]KNH43749.1 hypothetical protein ACS73_24490 [Pseudomonas lini]MDT9676861.1 hypothetical protein [Pseudomonas sp. JV414]NSX12347.1 hypothetical protein [Pseudomonas lini]
MSLYSQYALAGLGIVLLYTCIRSYVLRKWLGVALVGLGFGVIFVLPPYIGSIDVGIFAIAIVGAGASMFFNRSKYRV